MSKKLTIKIELELNPAVLAEHFILTDHAFNAVANSWHLFQDNLEDKLAEALMETDPTLGHLWQIAHNTEYLHANGDVRQCYLDIRSRAYKAAKEYLTRNFTVPEQFYPAIKGDVA